MANKKIIILGEELTFWFQLHTTDKLMTKLKQEAVEKDVSANALLNTILYDRYFRNKKATK